MGCNNSRDAAEVAPQRDPSQFRGQKCFVQENKAQVKDFYQFENKLGEGAFGSVRRIIDKTTKEEKALKIIKKDPKDKTQEARLNQEIAALSKLDHYSIIKFYEYYQDKKNYYIVTELVKGGELFDKISDLDHFSERDAAYIFCQLISVVQFAHEHKIMHRDIKPENILLEYNPNSKDSRYTIKIIDWGSATDFTPGKKYDEKAGTPYYIAPEVLKKSYDEKCDLWSCGVILYIIISGEPPFFGSEVDLYNNIISIKYDMDQDIWKSVSKECQDLIKQLLCPADKRLSAQQIQEHPWVKKHVEAFKQEGKGTAEDKIQSVLQLTKLKKFVQQNQLYMVALQYVSQRLATKEDREEFKKLFQKLDKNNDGQLSKEEISNGFMEHAAYFHGDYDIEQIFKNIDLDGNGKVNFSEFITASIQSDQKYLQSKLKRAFDAFDLDKNGSMSVDEIKSIFGKGNKESDKEILEILKKYDQNKDNQISLEEFTNMMISYGDIKAQ